MKLAFFYPFATYRYGTPLKWLPLSTSSLIGNIKKDFPDIEFAQFDLKKEINYLFSKNKLDESYKRIIKEIVDEYYNEIGLKYNGIYKYSLKLENFFNDVVVKLNLDQYDHYFFSVHARDTVGLVANFLFAKHLKEKHPNKKIIFGGIYGVGLRVSVRSLFKTNPKFIDSLVIGPGENSTRAILQALISGEKLKDKYFLKVFPEEMLSDIPDFTTFKSMDHFNHTVHDIERFYKHKLFEKGLNEKMLFIPYVFSKKCHWAKCAYCAESRRGDSRYTTRFYQKDIDLIINDIKRLKNIQNKIFYIF
jgi:hypothetical protein